MGCGEGTGTLTGIGANAGANDDPDFDGIGNLMEYVLGGLPIGAGSSDNSILPTQTLPDASTLRFTFHRSDLSEVDTTQKVQISTDLGTWTDVATAGTTTALSSTALGATATVTENSPTADLDTVIVNIPRSNEVGGKLFARLIVIKN